MFKPWCTENGAYWRNHESEQVSRVDAGIYGVNHSPMRGAFIYKKPIKSDSLIAFPDSKAEQIVDEIASFWKYRQRFHDRGFVHKRGVLMHGNPGSGKTATIVQLCDLMVQRQGGIVIQDLYNPGFASDILSMIRKNEPLTPIMMVLEDIDNWMENSGDESEWLSILDGENQIDGIVFVATSNHIDKLSPRLRCRPSRFDLVVEIAPPCREARKIFFATKEPHAPESAINLWTDLSDGFSFAHMKELLILSCIYNMDTHIAAQRVREMIESPQECHGSPQVSVVEDQAPSMPVLAWPGR